MTTQPLTVCQLLALTCKPVSVWIRRVVLLIKRDAEFFNEAHFTRQIDNGMRGKRDVQKRIMRINVELRDLGN